MPIVLPPSVDPLTDHHGAAFASRLPLRNGAGITLPDGLTYVIIVFTNRSGSSYLGELLASTGFFNPAKEVLNEDQVIPACAANVWASFSSYFAATAAEHARNRHFVFKSSIGQLAVMNHHGLLPRLLPHARFLLVERSDKLAQAISWSIATQTGQYTSLDATKDRPAPSYDSLALREHIAFMIQVHASIDQFMALNGLQGLRLSYEIITSQPLVAGALACGWLGQPDLRCRPERIPLQRQATGRNDEWRTRFLAEPAEVRLPRPARPAVPTTQVYRSASLWDISADKSAVFEGRPAVERRPFLEASALDVPPIAFGDSDFTREGIVLNPPGDPGAVRVQRGAQPAFLLRGVIVHGKYGILTIGERVVAQTLLHLPLHHIAESGWEADGRLRLPDLKLSATVHSAYHLLACNLDNYYHWLIDAMTRFRPAEYEAFEREPDTAGKPNVLIPTLDVFWKWESLGLTLPRGVPRLPLTGDGRAFVQRLLYVPDLSGGAFNPHPALLEAFDAIRAAVLGGSPTSPPTRRIYVSRADSRNRVLVNEAEVIARAENAGFTHVVLTKMAVPDQIRLFAEASHILAPHGAGLTNVAFCQPGARLCELQMDSYVHWAFRRIAALRGVRYGCLVGTTVSRHPVAVHGNTWRIDLDAVDAVLADPRFIGGD